jgi:hypothetical protein
LVNQSRAQSFRAGRTATSPDAGRPFTLVGSDKNGRVAALRRTSHAKPPQPLDLSSLAFNRQRAPPIEVSAVPPVRANTSKPPPTSSPARFQPPRQMAAETARRSFGPPIAAGGSTSSPLSLPRPSSSFTRTGDDNSELVIHHHNFLSRLRRWKHGFSKTSENLNEIYHRKSSESAIQNMIYGPLNASCYLENCVTTQRIA